MLFTARASGLTVLGLTALLALGSQAHASVIFTLGNNPQPGEENVLLNKGTSGNTVFGDTNQSNTLVQFDSTQTLFEPSNGQARIEAIDGNGDQIGLTDITISVPDGTFGDLIFNPHIGGQVGTTGAATVTAFADDGTFTFDYPSGLGNGENFLTITTADNEVLQSVNISAPDGFTDLRQVRISGIQGGGGGGGGDVPEPGTMALLVSSGLVGFGWARRRQSRRQ